MSTLLSLISGSLTGIVGKAVNSFFLYKMKKDEYRHKENMIDKESEAMIAEAKAKNELEAIIYQGKTDLAKIETDTQKEIASTQAFETSLKREFKINEITYKTVNKLFDVQGNLRFFTIPCGVILVSLITLVDILRSAMRPIITSLYTYVLIYVLYQYFYIMNQYKESFINNTETLIPIIMSIIDAIIYITMTCTTWWFGERSDKSLLKHIYRKK